MDYYLFLVFENIDKICIRDKFRVEKFMNLVILVF